MLRLTLGFTVEASSDLLGFMVLVAGSAQFLNMPSCL
jgi:hypothetical protein